MPNKGEKMEQDNPFKILNETAQASKEIRPQDVSGELEERIRSLIAMDKFVLFMKGNEQFPQCGFSANTVAILKHIGAKFSTFNILEDMDVREGLKQFSNWPTYPQLYFNGKLVGGNDIITEMFEAGELQELVNNS